MPAPAPWASINRQSGLSGTRIIADTLPISGEMLMDKDFLFIGIILTSH
jgi:hypothetical protein